MAENHIIIIKETLMDAGFEVIGMAENGETALEMAMDLQPDIITLDNILPDMTGIDILKVLKAEELASRIIMISAVGQQSVVDEGLRLGAVDYIVKPFTNEKLISAVRQAAESV
jgi:two-component system chemotaxis response regulator CheY